MQRILYGFDSYCVHLPGSCTANLYGQVSCDYTGSQSQRMVLNDLRKSHNLRLVSNPADEQRFLSSGDASSGSLLGFG